MDNNFNQNSNQNNNANNYQNNNQLNNQSGMSQPNQPYWSYNPYPSEPKNTMATVAMILGLCSILSLCTFVLPLPLGALSIVFVILSHRKGKKLTNMAISGLVTSLISISVSIVLLASVFTTAIDMLKPENRDKLNQQFEQIYGTNFEEYMERIYGDDFGDMMKELENLR